MGMSTTTYRDLLAHFDLGFFQSSLHLGILLFELGDLIALESISAYFEC